MTTMCLATRERQLTYSPTPMASQEYDGGQLGKDEVPICFAICIEGKQVHQAF